jgi:hypothetical protein
MSAGACSAPTATVHGLLGDISGLGTQVENMVNILNEEIQEVQVEDGAIDPPCGASVLSKLRQVQMQLGRVNEKLAAALAAVGGKS